MDVHCRSTVIFVRAKIPNGIFHYELHVVKRKLPNKTVHFVVILHV